MAHPKHVGALTAECSLPLFSFLSWSEDILLDPKILGVDLTTKFRSQRPITEKKGKKGTHGNASLLFFLFPLYYRVRACIRLSGLFCRILEHQHDLNEKCLLFSCPEKSNYAEEVWCACLFHPWVAGENIYHHSPLRR